MRVQVCGSTIGQVMGNYHVVLGCSGRILTVSRCSEICISLGIVPTIEAEIIGNDFLSIHLNDVCLLFCGDYPYLQNDGRATIT